MCKPPTNRGYTGGREGANTPLITTHRKGVLVKKGHTAIKVRLYNRSLPTADLTTLRKPTPQSSIGGVCIVLEPLFVALTLTVNPRATTGTLSLPVTLS